jgi:hypothetical protein
MNKKVVSIDLTKGMAQKIIRELSQDSANVFLIDHAKKSMKKRYITLTQIIQCLSKGNITEGPYQDIGSGNWRVRMEYYTAGQCIKVVAELMTNDNNEKIIVITTF